MTNSGDAAIDQISKGAGCPGTDAAERLPTSTNLFEHEQNGVGLLHKRIVGAYDDDTVRQSSPRRPRQFLLEGFSLQRCEQKPTTIGIVSQRKKDRPVAKTTVAVVKDKGMLALHRFIILAVISAAGAVSGPAIAGVQAEDQKQEPIELTGSNAITEAAHHRVDVGIDRFGGSKTSITTLNLGYRSRTRVPGPEPGRCWARL